MLRCHCWGLMGRDNANGPLFVLLRGAVWNMKRMINQLTHLAASRRKWWGGHRGYNMLKMMCVLTIAFVHVFCVNNDTSGLTTIPTRFLMVRSPRKRSSFGAGTLSSVALKASSRWIGWTTSAWS